MLPVTNDPVAQTITLKVAELYNLKPTAYLPPNKGYRNHSLAFKAGAQWYTVIVYKQEDGIRELIARANLAGDTAANNGYPARQTVDGRILRIGARYACLYYYLPGKTIPWEAYTRRHLVELGRMMAILHSTWDAEMKLPAVEAIMMSQIDDMHRYFAKDGVQQALADKLNLKLPDLALKSFSELVSQLVSEPLRQPLHLDYVRGNILFDAAAAQPRICGVIDFEKAACGHPMIDVARTLAFLIVDCKYQTPKRVQRAFLAQGYLSHAQTKAPSITSQQFTKLINYYLFYDFYKFLKHNPYESLKQNEHFRRTAALLMQKQVLQLL